MIKEIVNICKVQIESAAKRYFRSICQLGMGEQNQELLEALNQAHQIIIERLCLRAVVRRFDPDAIEDNGMYIEGLYFPCRSFAGLAKEHVQAVYAFVLTAGDIKNAEQSIINMMCCDFWGTAYINAANDFLREILRNKHNQLSYASEAFGPGYFNMQLEKLEDLWQIVDGGDIGVILHKNHMMEPLKSCAGFYLITNDKITASFLDDRCSYCAKGGAGCAFCAHQKGRQY